jgi:phage terminase large subunit-like protein
MKYTNEQIREISKAMDDIEYFAENFVKINHPVHGLASINLNDFQRQVIRDFTSKKIFFTPGPRQKGKTTIAAIILLHQALFNEYRTSIIFARNKVATDSILKCVVDMYDTLPDFMKVSSIIKRNKSKIEFENYCSIISAGNNVDYSRGMTISTVYIDESEWFDNLDAVMKGLYPVMASVNYSRLFALSSTYTGVTLEYHGFEAA